MASYYWKYSNDILSGSWIQILDTEGLIDNKTKYLNLSIGSFLYVYNNNNVLDKKLKIISGGANDNNIYLEGDNLLGEGSLKWDNDEGKLYYNKTSFDRTINNRIFKSILEGRVY